MKLLGRDAWRKEAAADAAMAHAVPALGQGATERERGGRQIQ